MSRWEERIPRIVIGAVSSGAGKTTVVTGLLRALRTRGMKVQAYKVGPDYIDTGYHQIATERPSHNLDSWLFTQEELQALFKRTAKGADIAIIEGVMGLYDGGRQGVSSTAEIAKLLDAPVLLVVDAKSMGSSAAATALGYRNYDRDLDLRGVILNRLGSETHEKMIREAMQEIQMPVFGAVRRMADISMSERHLGLLPTEENTALYTIDRMGQVMEDALDIDSILGAAEQVSIYLDNQDMHPIYAQQIGDGLTVAVARDAAFSFYYPESLAVLERFGARIVYFSPLRDTCLPDADALLIGGGFPEMFAGQLSENTAMRNAIYRVAESGMPIYAECGGYMYLMKELIDFHGLKHTMVGAFEGTARMTEKLQMVGYIEAEMIADTILGVQGTRIRGHEFHFSVETASDSGREMHRPFVFSKLRDGKTYSAGQVWKNVLGSYLHLHFAGAPKAAAQFLQTAKRWR